MDQVNCHMVKLEIVSSSLLPKSYSIRSLTFAPFEIIDVMSHPQLSSSFTARTVLPGNAL